MGARHIDNSLITVLDSDTNARYLSTVFSAVCPTTILKTLDPISYSFCRGATDASGRKLIRLRLGREEGKIDAYHREVMDAAITLYAAGNSVFPIQMLARVLSGNVDRDTAPLIMRTKAAQALDHLLSMKYVLLQKDTAIGEESPADVSLEGTMLTGTKALIRRKTGGSLIVYELAAAPFVYSYASLLERREGSRMIMRAPIQLLDSPVNKTVDVIALQGALIRSVEQIRDSGADGGYILFTDLFRESWGPGELRKQEKQRGRQQVTAILDYWIKIKYIRSYELHKEKREILSIYVSHEPLI